MNTLQETLVRPVHQVGLYFMSAAAAKGGGLGGLYWQGATLQCWIDHHRQFVIMTDSLFSHWWFRRNFVRFQLFMLVLCRKLILVVSYRYDIVSQSYATSGFPRYCDFIGYQSYVRFKTLVMYTNDASPLWLARWSKTLFEWRVLFRSSVGRATRSTRITWTKRTEGRARRLSSLLLKQIIWDL